MDLRHRGCTFADACGDALDRPAPHISDREDARIAGLQRNSGSLPVMMKPLSSSAIRWSSQPVFRIGAGEQERSAGRRCAV